MKAVLDASVLVRAVVPGQTHHAQVRNWLKSIRELCAPHLLPFEVATAIRRLEFAGAITQETAESALREALRLRVRLWTPPGLHLEALRVARQLGISRARDTAYLALAIHAGCPLFTLDERFLRDAQGKGYAVLHPVSGSG